MVMNAVTSRKSVRNYSDRPIEDSVLNKILEAGRFAPSWVNVQPWKFIVVKSQATKDLLSESTGGQKQVKNAQVVICCVADIQDWDKSRFGKVLEQRGLDNDTKNFMLESKLYNPANLGEFEALMRSVEQLTYAVAYMTLEAHELGVGACIVGAFANELTKKDDELAKKVKSVLGLNDKQVLVDLLTLGYEAESVEIKKFRKPVEDVVFYELL